MTIQLAGCVIFDADGKILLLHRNTAQFQHWELPGGKVEKEETQAEAAARELEEEVGVEVKITGKLGRTTFKDANGQFDYVWFKAEIVRGQPTINEPEMFDSFNYFTVDEMATLHLSVNMEELFTKLSTGTIPI